MILESFIAPVIVTGVTALSALVWTRFVRDRIVVKRILSAEQAEVDGLLELYVRLFPNDGTNYQPSEVLGFMHPRPDDRGIEVENIVLTAKFHGEVVGFVFCHYYPAERKAIISYLAIDRECREARMTAASSILARLLKILSDNRHPGEFLFFDLQGIDPDDPNVNSEERRLRRDRPVRFRRRAKEFGRKAVEFAFDYRCPKVTMEPESREYPFTLMCVPLQNELSNPIPKARALEFLGFIYKTCYGDVYPEGHPDREAHLRHLDDMVRHYAETLPDHVAVK